MGRDKVILMMNKYTASERKVDLYDIWGGFTLLIVGMKNEEGKTKSVHTLYKV